MSLTNLNIQQVDAGGIENTDIASKASVNLVQDNVSALSSNVNVSNAWVNANDYTTYLQAQSNDYATLLAARSNDYSTYLQAQANDYSTYLTLTANIYNTYSALSSGGSNTQLYVGNTLVSNTAVILQAGNGVSLVANATSKVVIFTTAMSNVTSQEFTANGASNVFTLTKGASNTHMILVSYNGILQKPTTYTIDGTTLTLSNTRPIAANSDIEVRFFDFFDLPGNTSGGGGSSYSFQGSVSGYSSGGEPVNNTVDKFPFSSDGNATNVGDLTSARFGGAGQSSSSSGYTSGGYVPAAVNTIDKFSFSTDGNASDVGDLSRTTRGAAGQSSSTNGYTSGGNGFNTIDKFPFASDGSASDVGDLTRAGAAITGQSSTTSGYSAGNNPQNTGNIIDKFPFAADGNASDVGDLTQSRFGTGGQSSTTSGYNSGGLNPSLTPAIRNTIDKFPFASDANATDVGDLTQARRYLAGQSSTASGYTAGGDGGITTIDKFPFATNANATDVGDLTVGRGYAAGQQI